MSFELGNIRPANHMWMPQKIILYGPHGLGKTKWGSTFESPILLRIEDGAGAIDVPTFPEIVTRWQDLEDVFVALYGDHPFRTLLIDSADWLEPILWQALMYDRPENEKGQEVKSIEDYGFGKGYGMVDEWWRYLLGKLDALRTDMGMNVVVIAHSEVKLYSPPESEPYDRYQIKLHKRASNLWQEWADMVLFGNFKSTIKKTNEGFNKEVKKGVGSGERVIYTEVRPAFQAKNRWGLPSEILIGQDKTWSAFHRALNDATNGKYFPSYGA